jgi:hypothetical protein
LIKPYGEQKIKRIAIVAMNQLIALTMHALVVWWCGINEPFNCSNIPCTFMVGNATTSNACMCTIMNFMGHEKWKGSGDNDVDKIKKVGNDPVTEI